MSKNGPWAVITVLVCGLAAAAYFVWAGLRASSAVPASDKIAAPPSGASQTNRSTAPSIYAPFRMRHAYAEDILFFEKEIKDRLLQAGRQGREIVFVAEFGGCPLENPADIDRFLAYAPEHLSDLLAQLRANGASAYAKAIQEGEGWEGLNNPFHVQCARILRWAEQLGYHIRVESEEAPLESVVISCRRRANRAETWTLFEAGKFDEYLDRMALVQRQKEKFVRLRDEAYEKKIEALRAIPGRLIIDFRGVLHRIPGGDVLKNQEYLKFELESVYGADELDVRRELGIAVPTRDAHRLFANDYVGRLIVPLMKEHDKTSEISIDAAAKLITEQLTLGETRQLSKELAVFLARHPVIKEDTSLQKARWVHRWLASHGKIPDHVKSSPPPMTDPI